MSFIHCNINGQDVACGPGVTVLEAARAAGIDIPSLCYFKELNQIGACRICVVEIEGMPRLMAACTTPVKDGMMIHTESEKVIASRKRSLDLICKRHRMDCEYCPNYSFCELHAVLRKLGMDDRPYSRVYHERKADESSRSIIRDNSKCIRCRRCVAACKKQCVEAIGALNRAEATTIGARLPMAETNCIGCGQCVKSCPTGALFVRDDTDALWRAQNQGKKIVFGIMPETAQNIGRFFYESEEKNQIDRLTAICKKAGTYEVFDLTGLKETALSRLAAEAERCGKKGEGPLSISICPAEKNREKQSGKILFGAGLEEIFCKLASNRYAQQGIPREEIFLVYVSACTAAKRCPASDAVLTTVELFQWIQRACVSRFTAADVWGKTAGMAPVKLIDGPKDGFDEAAAPAVFACPDGCRNGGGQFRTNGAWK